MNNAHSRPLAIDLFTGLHGWSEGLVAEGWRVVGFDLEDMCGQFRQPRPEHVQLVIQDVLTLHGSQFRNADLIVASPPCQKYSYMAMPWSRAKDQAAAIRADESGQALADLNRLFDACFRIQREACEAAGRHIPMVVENVKGAQPWVGRARWSFGSFFLWGDVPALMPPVVKAVKVGGLDWKHPDDPRHRPGQAFNPAAQGKALQEARATKNAGGSWFNVAHNTTSCKGRNPDGRKSDGGTWFGNYEQMAEGVKQRGSGREWFAGDGKISRMTSSGSPARKMASAMIAKIPLPLSRWIAATYRPIAEAAE